MQNSLNFKPTRHHYILRNWVLSLENNVEHSRYLVDTYPDDPRSNFECSMLNSYEKLYNFLINGEDTTFTQEDYETLLRVVKEAMQMKKGFQKIQKIQKVEPEVSEPIVIAQTQVSTAPELIGDIDTDILEQQLHQSNMEEIPEVPKKKKKVKSN